MRLTVRPSIFLYLLYGLVAVSLVVTTLLMLANQAVRQSTKSLENVVVNHVRPLAAAQRLQSRIDTLRGLELELHQFNDFFAVPYHLDGMQNELDAIDSELSALHTPLSHSQPHDAVRLDEHWHIYRSAVEDELRLTRAMDMDGLAAISSSRSRGAHDAISAILRDLIERTEKASTAAYSQAQYEAGRQQTLVTTVLACGLLLLFAGLWYFGRSVSRRITALNDAANAVTRGDLAEPIRDTGRDELTELGHAFNTMQAKVLEREEELRGAHERLEQRAQTAEEATLAKSQFLANMSHEIRTPMNGVLGMLDILRETTMSPEQEDYLATAHESAAALLELLNDILDLSKIEAGKVRLEELEFDLEQVVDDAVALLADRAYAKGLKLSVSIDAGLPHHLYGDPNRLRQVMNNLLSNAIKFTTQGHVDIAVTPTSAHDGSPLLHVEVSDTGIGIAFAKQARIFDAFTQADGSTTRQFGGTGLGLTISSQLVDAMDGQIGVESAPGLGSKFWFTIPLEAADGPVHLTPAALADTHVLIVDEDVGQRQQLARRLEAWGCMVHSSPDGANIETMSQAALDAGKPFRLAMVAGAAATTGTRETVAWLRTANPDAKVVLLSPPGQPCADEDIRALAIEHCLPRPLRKSQLRNCLLHLLGELQPAPEKGGAIVGRTLRVLVAEDNPINQKVASSMLHKIGCKADIATNGREALERTRERLYDLVFMDCQMPEMDGFEATEAIRQQETGPKRVPIIAMTAHAMPSDRERCMAAGMDDYLTKPISVEQLRAVIARWREHAPAA
jgi:signal transduction histidine kinase/DNA-binding response OmpR family regulator